MANNSLNLSFGGQKNPPPPQNAPAMAQQMASVSRRLRMVEEVQSNMRRKMDLHEQNTLEDLKKIKKDLELFFEEKDELARQIKSIKSDMTKIIQELQQTAKQNEVKTLEKYIEIWNPVQFVTQKQVERIATDIVRQHLQSTPTQTHKQPEQSQVVPPKPQTPSPSISDEQKRKIAAYFDSNPDMEKLLVANVQGFARIIENNPKLQTLFANINIQKLSDKLKEHHEHA
ncbi:MAG: hypothetical protein ACMXYF_00670 [Candidatus Woesearchaeota archaeon]